MMLLWSGCVMPLPGPQAPDQQVQVLRQALVALQAATFERPRTGGSHQDAGRLRDAERVGVDGQVGGNGATVRMTGHHQGLHDGPGMIAGV